jgi:hypothetical protein
MGATREPEVPFRVWCKCVQPEPGAYQQCCRCFRPVLALTLARLVERDKITQEEADAYQPL